MPTAGHGSISRLPLVGRWALLCRFLCQVNLLLLRVLLRPHGVRRGKGSLKMPCQWVKFKLASKFGRIVKPAVPVGFLPIREFSINFMEFLGVETLKIRESCASSCGQHLTFSEPGRWGCCKRIWGQIWLRSQTLRFLASDLLFWVKVLRSFHPSLIHLLHISIHNATLGTPTMGSKPQETKLFRDVFRFGASRERLLVEAPEQPRGHGGIFMAAEDGNIPALRHFLRVAPERVDEKNSYGRWPQKTPVDLRVLPGGRCKVEGRCQKKTLKILKFGA